MHEAEDRAVRLSAGMLRKGSHLVAASWRAVYVFFITLDTAQTCLPLKGHPEQAVTNCSPACEWYSNVEPNPLLVFSECSP